MTEEELFLFDLQGFIRVPHALPENHVKDLNLVIDAHPELRVESAIGTGSLNTAALSGQRRRESWGTDPLRMETKHASPFRRLISLPCVRPYLNGIVGRGWRLDSFPEVIMSLAGADGLTLHGSGSRLFSPASYYICRDGMIRCGFVTVEYALNEMHPGDGGFACIPGSHKANFPCPRGIRGLEERPELIQEVYLEPGDALIFCEALIHGTLPWHGTSERRVVIFRYTPRTNAVAPPASSYLAYTRADWVEQLDEQARAAIEPAYVPDRPTVGEDGSVKRVTDWF